MKTLLQSTQAYQIIKTEGRERRFSHTYLLLFDDARNLRSALKTFAKIFFDCDGEYYGEQDADKKRIANLIDNENFSDCLFFPEDGKTMKKEDAEKIHEESTLAPVEGSKKLFVISDFAEANTVTQNKLLKLLEEPPAGVYFLLGATTSYSVLQTVLSRAKKLEILSFGVDETADCLARIYGNKYDRSILSLCAAASGGNLGQAQGMLEGGHYKTLLENAFSLVLCQSYQLPTVVKQLGEFKQQKELIAMLRLVFRDALVVKTQGKRAGRNLLMKTEVSRIEQVAERYSLPALFTAQEVLSDAEKQVKFNAVFSQCIELCIAKIQSKNN